jgi:hypothetical protein
MKKRSTKNKVQPDILLPGDHSDIHDVLTGSAMKLKSSIKSESPLVEVEASHYIGHTERIGNPGPKAADNEEIKQNHKKDSSSDGGNMDHKRRESDLRSETHSDDDYSLYEDSDSDIESEKSLNSINDEVHSPSSKAANMKKHTKDKKGRRFTVRSSTRKKTSGKSRHKEKLLSI